MRLEYVSTPQKTLEGEDLEILQRVEERRGTQGLLPLDLTLLLAPKYADGWNTLLSAIRTKTSITDDVREVVICRTALINRAWFEWKHHAPLLLASEGFTQDKFSVIQQTHPSCQGPLSDCQWAVLRYADAMTRDVTISQTLFQEVKSMGFSDQQMVELTATIATYNMVGRFLVALDVGEMNDKSPGGIASKSF